MEDKITPEEIKKIRKKLIEMCMKGRWARRRAEAELGITEREAREDPTKALMFELAKYRLCKTLVDRMLPERLASEELKVVEELMERVGAK